MLAILRQRNFTLLWIGQLISVFGDWVLLIALPFYIFDLTGSALATGAMFMAGNLPRVLFGSVAGVFVDRWDRKRMMIAADLSRAALLLALLTVHSVHWLWIVYVVAFTQAVIGQFFSPAKNAVIPLLVSESDLVSANALNSLSENLTRLTAPALGGALFALLGLHSVVYVDSASFLVSGVLIALIAFPASSHHAARPTRDLAIRAVWSDWHDGLRLMRRDATITAIFATMGTAMIAEGFFTVMLVPLVKEIFAGGPQAFGWLASAQAVGGLIGSMLLGRVSKVLRPGILIPVSGVLFGLLDISLVNVPERVALPTLPVALGLIGVAGIPIVGFFTGQQALLQANVADEFRGRVFGAFGTTVALMTLVGQGVGSVLGERIGVVPTITLAGCFDILAALVAFVLLRRAARDTVDIRPSEIATVVATED